jgi:hypothetical protein
LLSSIAFLAVSQLCNDVTGGDLLSAAQDEAMAAQGKAFLGQYLLPLIAGADSVALVQEPFCFLSGGEPCANLARSGCSAHSMRATFITTALENGAQLEDVQKAAGYRDPGTTKLYDGRGYNPENAASSFATY